MNRTRVISAAILAALGGRTVPADVVSLNPVADAFIASGHPDSNYGGGGSLAVAATGLANGEFQTLLRFDAAAAASDFDASLGPGQWSIQSVTLRLAFAFPNNPLFNSSSPGQFSITWMQNDDWLEGTGTPNTPEATGVRFADLPGLLSAGGQDLGVFSFDGSTSDVTTIDLALAPGFIADVRAGSLVTLRIHAADANIAMLVNSRTFVNAANRPVLTITAGIVEPFCYANCDLSTAAPVLNANDFQCFLNKYAAGESGANCDHSTAAPVLNANDFQCFLNAFATGCS